MGPSASADLSPVVPRRHRAEVLIGLGIYIYSLISHRSPAEDED